MRFPWNNLILNGSLRREQIVSSTLNPSPRWPCLMGMDFSRPWADVPRLSRFLLNSESVNFVTQSITMISWGSKIAVSIFRECHRKFYRVLCKFPKRALRLLLPSWWGVGGDDVRQQVGWSPPLNAGWSLSNTGGNPKCLFTPWMQSLQAYFSPYLSCLPSPGVSFGRLKGRF